MLGHCLTASGPGESVGLRWATRYAHDGRSGVKKGTSGLRLSPPVASKVDGKVISPCGSCNGSSSRPSFCAVHLAGSSVGVLYPVLGSSSNEGGPSSLTTLHPRCTLTPAGANWCCDAGGSQLCPVLGSCSGQVEGGCIARNQPLRNQVVRE